MFKQIINVSKLEGMELDYWVAKAQGQDVIGKALAHYDPESGYPTVDYDQVPVHKGFMQTHERYFYVANCACDICEETYQEMKREYPDTTREPKILGHDWRCLEAVVDYSTSNQYVADIMEQANIMVKPDNSNPEKTFWIASNVPKGEEAEIYEMPGKTIAQAVMRAFVATKYGTSICC